MISAYENLDRATFTCTPTPRAYLVHGHAACGGRDPQITVLPALTDLVKIIVQPACVASVKLIVPPLKKRPSKLTVPPPNTALWKWVGPPTNLAVRN